jgi:hypothetical protein
MTKLVSSASEAVATFGVHTLRYLPEIFREERKSVSYDMLFSDPKDGCARYDDVWGG